MAKREKKNGNGNGNDFLATHAKVVGLKRLKGESDIEFQERILDTIAALPDEKWEELPEETQIWSNELELAKKQEAEAKTKANKKSKGKPKKKKDKALEEAKKKAKEAASSAIEPRRKVWAPDTNSGQIYRIMMKTGEKGITIPEAIKQAKKQKVKSTNIEGRVPQILRYSCRIGLARRTEDNRFIATPPPGDID